MQSNYHSLNLQRNLQQHHSFLKRFVGVFDKKHGTYDSDNSVTASVWLEYPQCDSEADLLTHVYMKYERRKEEKRL